MTEDDRPDLEIRDGSPALLEELLARTRPSKRPPAAGAGPEPQSEAERIFQEWLDRTAPE